MESWLDDLDQLRSQPARDLAWSLASPGLLSSAYPEYQDKLLTDSWCRAELARAWERLKYLDTHPEALESVVESAAKERLLGRYFEAVLGFWITELIRPETFLSALPVLGAGRRTLGELDFIFRESLAVAPMHWEASIKFYLCVGDGSELKHFLGTEVRDRLDLKIRKLFDHQLALPKMLEARKILAPLGLDQPVSKVWMKGALFYPRQSNWENHRFPEAVSPEHWRGWWAEHQDLRERFSLRSDLRWVVLPKYHWVSPARRGGEEVLSSAEQLIDTMCAHFNSHHYALMIAGLELGAGGWREVERGLIVRTGWTQEAEASLTPAL